MLIETDRLFLREMTMADFKEIAAFLKDKEVMYAYEHGFSDKEVYNWIKCQIDRYEKYGFGLWAVILKQCGTLIGDCGITMQNCGERMVHEIGYHLNKEYWHNGYATEAAEACKKYAFSELGISEVFSIIRDSNIASQKVARRNGMSEKGTFVKRYYNMDMLHYIFSVKK